MSRSEDLRALFTSEQLEALDTVREALVLDPTALDNRGHDSGEIKDH